MSSDDPPNNYFNGIGYNPLFYVKDTTSSGLTKTNADIYYLSKIISDTSTATLTTFTQDITATNKITAGSIMSANYNTPNTIGSTVFCSATTAGTIIIGVSLTSGSVIIGNNNTTSTTNILNRINFTGTTSYSFGAYTNTNLGYVSKTTGTPIATPIFSSATPTVMATSPVIPIGVWRVDYAVQNTVGSAGAGTITSAQSYVATLAASTTQLLLMGYLICSYISEVYSNNYVQVIASSFTI